VRRVVVPRPRWHERLLLYLRNQVEELFKDYQAQIGQAPHARPACDSSEGRCTMSAALTLPYVWATVSTPVRQKHASRPAEGLAFYRKRTERLLRRYMRASLAVGRVPSVVEDITLRGRASSCRLKNFEDVVNFTIDVERCLRTLDASVLQLVVKIALQEYLMQDVADHMRLDVRTVARSYGAALDHLTAVLLERKLLVRED
jgi:hypothetical protein